MRGAWINSAKIARLARIPRAESRRLPINRRRWNYAVEGWRDASTGLVIVLRKISVRGGLRANVSQQG